MNPIFKSLTEQRLRVLPTANGLYCFGLGGGILSLDYLRKLAHHANDGGRRIVLEITPDGGDFDDPLPLGPAGGGKHA